MRFSWILSACVLTLAALPNGGFAQDRHNETSLYSSQRSSVPDPNYGLPTFGMPGSDVPRQKTMAPENPVPTEPDFFKGATEIPLPDSKSSASAEAGMETPQYTTTDGSTTDGTTSSDETAPR